MSMFNHILVPVDGSAPSFMAVRKAIDDGKIGDVEMVTITSRDPGAPPVDYIKRSGGIFRDMTIHDFDMARFLLGEEVVSVSATAAVEYSIP